MFKERFQKMSLAFRLTIVIILLALAGVMLAGFYFFKKSPVSPAMVDMRQLDSEYQQQVKNFLNHYLTLANSQASLLNQDFVRATDDFKNELMSLTMSESLKDNHLKLFFLVTNI